MTSRTPRLRAWGGCDQRGAGSGVLSIILLLLVPVIILICGLVVDGGRKAAAAQEAQIVAAGAARAGADAAATTRLGGHADLARGIRVANTYLAGAPEVDGTVGVTPDGRLVVTTWSTRPTLYLSVLGLDQVTGHGYSTASPMGPD